MLFGMLLLVFFSFVQTSGWTRASRFKKGIYITVMVLTTVNTGLYLNDLFYYALTFTTEIAVLISGTPAGTAEPIFNGLLSVIVQQVLAWRASLLIRSDRRRWLYLTVIGLGSLLSLIASVGVFVSWSWYMIYHEVFVFPIRYWGLLTVSMFSSAGTDVIISLSYVYLIRRNVKEKSEVGSSAVRLISRYVIESASAVTFFAVASAVIEVSTNPDDPKQFSMSLITYLPCSALYALSLFMSLSIADRVRDKMSHFGRSDIIEEGNRSRFSHATDSRSSCRGSSSPTRSALEGMITRPGEPAWEQRSTSFLGVKVALQPHESPSEKEGRPAFSRAQSSAL